jgi:hypothetical protein
MTLTEALAVKARGLTKEQIIAHLRAVAENNLRADVRTIERAWREKPSEGISAAPTSSGQSGHIEQPPRRLAAILLMLSSHY